MSTVNKEVLKELEIRLSTKEGKLREVEEEIEALNSIGSSAVRLLESMANSLRAEIRGLKKGIKWENERYDYLTGTSGYLEWLPKYLGKEVVTSFRSDKGVPQILLGIYWKDGIPNYSSSKWVAIVRYTLNGRTTDGEVDPKYVVGVNDE